MRSRKRLLEYTYNVSNDSLNKHSFALINGIRIVLYNADATSQQLFAVATDTTDTLYKIRRVNGTFTFSKSSDDGATWTNMSINSQSASLTTEDVLFGFVISTTTSRSITFHDLRIYPV